MSSLSDDPSLSRKVYKKFYKNSMLTLLVAHCIMTETCMEKEEADPAATIAGP